MKDKAKAVQHLAILTAMVNALLVKVETQGDLELCLMQAHRDCLMAGLDDREFHRLSSVVTLQWHKLQKGNRKKK